MSLEISVERPFPTPKAPPLTVLCKYIDDYIRHSTPDLPRTSSAKSTRFGFIFELWIDGWMDGWIQA